MPRTMLAAVHATEGWLVAPRYIIYDANFNPPSIFLHQTWSDQFIKHLTPYTGCISRVNLICIYFSCPQKYINSMLFVMAGFQWSQWSHRHKTHSFYSEFPIKHIFGFLALRKLTEWCCFVTYLSNNPRSNSMLTLTHILQHPYNTL